MNHPGLHQLLVPILLAASAGTHSAQEDVDRDSWSWRIAPYLWTAGIDGTLTTRNAEVDVEVDFSDIWDNLESAGLVFVEASRGQISLLGDVVYLGLEVDGEGPLGADADVELDTLILDLAGLYRLAPGSPVELGGGVRYLDFESDLDLGMVSSDGSSDALDGFAAGRLTWPFAQRFAVQVYGDVGAGDSDLTWQASVLLGWHLERWGLAVGYRMLDYEFDDGPNELDLTFEGFFYGVEFRF